MSRFYIGQRVRMVNLVQPENQKFNGVETRITGFMEFGAGPVPCGYGTTEIPLRSTGEIVEYDGRECRAWIHVREHQLEPILPSGHRPSEYTFTELMDRCRAGEGIPA